jgi:DNA-binding transcriptional ArsR family regulator
LKDTLSSVECAEYFKALADAERLRLVQALRERPQSVSDLAALLDNEIGNISHHLKVLRKHGLVTFRREGKTLIYTLSNAFSSSKRCKVDRFEFGCCSLEIPK